VLDIFVFVSYRYFIIKTLIVKSFILAFVPAGKIFSAGIFYRNLLAELEKWKNLNKP